jgi:hypothetical protein
MTAVGRNAEVIGWKRNGGFENRQMKSHRGARQHRTAARNF